MANATFNIGIKTSADLKAVNELRKQLEQIRRMANEGIAPLNLQKDLDPAQITATIRTVNELEKALNSAFDPHLNILNVQKFTHALQGAGLDANSLAQNLGNAGAAGEKALIGLTQSLTSMGSVVKSTNTFLDKMAVTFANTVRWQATTAALNAITGSVTGAYNYVEKLDSSLNDIRIVTHKSAEEMERFAESANKAAQKLAVSTRDYTEGSLIYYQQGLDDQTVKTLTDITAMTANVTGQGLDTVSEQLTAVWNGYQAANKAAAEGMQAYEGYVDKMAAVGATTASSLKEITEAMSKVSSTANSLGVDFDQLNAQIATIVAATRQDPANVGTALKTIYARISDIKAGSDEAEVSLGKYSGKMAELGFNVLDAEGKLRDQGKVIEEIGGSWKSLTREQQISLAQTMAGTRQYNNLIALFDNWANYEKTLETSLNATGTLQEQQGIAVESLSNKLQVLRTTLEELYQDLIDTDDISAVVEIVTKLVSGVDLLIDSLGGLRGILPVLGTIGLNVFSDKIGASLGNTISGITIANKQIEQVQKNLTALDKGEYAAIFGNQKAFENTDISQETKSSVQDIVGFYREMAPLRASMTEESLKEYDNVIKSKVAYANINAELAEAAKLFDEINRNRKLGFNTDDLKTFQTELTQINSALNAFSSSAKTTNNFKDSSGLYVHDQLFSQFGTNTDLAERVVGRFVSTEMIDGQATKVIDPSQTQVIIDYLNEISRLGNAYTSLTAKAADAKAGQENLTDTFKTKAAIEQQIAAITKLSSTLTSAASVAMIARNAFKTLFSEDLSPLEKTIQTMVSLGSLIPLLINFGTGTKEIISLTEQFITLQKLKIGKNTEETASLTALVAAKKAEIEQEKQKLLLQKESLKQQQLEIKNRIAERNWGMEQLGKSGKERRTLTLEEKERYQKFLQDNNIDPKEIKSKADKDNIFKLLKDSSEADERQISILSSQIDNLTSNISNFDEQIKKLPETIPAIQQSLNNLVGTIGKLLSSIGTFLSSHALIIGAFVLVGLAIYGTLKHINKLNDALDAANKKAEEAQKQYSELKTSLDELTSSTNKYYDAVAKVNSLNPNTDEYQEALEEANAVAEELIKNNEELSRTATFKDGLIILDNEVLNQAKQEKRKETVKAANDSYIAQRDVNRLQAEVNERDFRRKSKGGQDNKWISDKELQQLISALQNNNYNLTLTKDALLKVDGIGDHLAIALENNADNLVKLAKSNAALKNQNEVLGAQFANSIFNAEGLDMSSVEVQTGSIIAGKIIANETKGNAEKYAEMNGLTYESNWLREAFTGTYLFKDSSGNNVSAFIKVVEDAIADYNEVMANKVNNAQNIISNTVDNDTLKDFILKSIAANEAAFDGFSIDQIELLREWIESSDNRQKDNFNNLIEKYRNATGVSEDELNLTFNKLSEKLQSSRELSNIYSKASQTASANAKQVSEVSNLLEKKNSVDLTEKELELVEELEAKYSALGEIKNKDSHEYKQTLREIQEIEEKNAREAAQKARDEAKKTLEESRREAQRAKEKYGIEPDSSESKSNYEKAFQEATNKFEQDLQDVFDKEYQLKVAIDADLDSDIEEAFGLTDEINDLTNLIKEDFKYSIDDAQKLIAQGYGAMFENAKATADGMIQADKSVVNNFIDGRQEELKADKEAKVQQLKNERLILENQNKAIDAEISALTSYIETKTDADAELALQNAKNAEETYQREVEHMNALLENQDEALNTELTAEEQAGREKVALSDKTQIALSQSESDGTTAQAAEFKRRYQNIEQLYNAYVSLGAAVEEAGDGTVSATLTHPAFIRGGGGASISTDTSGISVSQAVSSEKIVAKNLSDLTGDRTAENKAAAQAIIDQLKANQEANSARIGAIDAAIAGLDSSWQNLDTTQATGGKKGSGGGNKSEKDEKKYDDEFNRYKDLENAIKQLDETLEDIDKRQSHLFGQELIDSLKQENELLDQQKAKYEELYEAQKKQVGELMGQLQNYGASFDASGALQNYAAITNAQLGAYNSAVQQYNAGALDDAAFKILETNYNTFKSTLEKYETMYYDTLQDTKDKLEDIWYRQIENNLKAWETEVQIQLDLSQAERDWSDFIKHISTDFKLRFKDIGQEVDNILDKVRSYTEDGGTIWTDISAINDVKAELEKFNAGGQSDMFVSASEAEEKLKELQKTLMDDAEDLYDLWEDTWDTYLDYIDQAEDKFDDLKEKYENINEELEYQGQLIQLLYGDDAYDLMEKMYSAQNQNNLAQIDSLRQQVDMWRQMAEAADENNEDYQKFYENWQNAQKELNDLVIENIELLKDRYMNTINSIIDNMEKKIFNGSTLDKFKEKWQDTVKWAEMYYDNIERTYQIETLMAKWQDAVDNGSSLKNQQELKDLMDAELADLEQEAYLSEYDIELSEKKLALYQARMALEDAQNAKNAMKLVRGEDGNWSYQYVSDEDEVSAKRQELQDAYYELYEFAKKSEQEAFETFLEMYERYKELVLEISEDTTLSVEEQQEKIDELYEEYWGEDGKLTILSEEFNERSQKFSEATADALWTLFKDDVTEYTNATDEMTVLQKTMEEVMTHSWEDITKEVLNSHAEMSKATTDYKAQIEETSKKAGQDFNNIEKAIDDAQTATRDLTNATQDLINKTTSGTNQMVGAVQRVEQAWLNVKDATLKALKALDAYSGSNFAGSAISAIASIGGEKVAAIQQAADAAAIAAAVGKESSPDMVKRNSQQEYKYEAFVDYYPGIGDIYSNNSVPANTNIIDYWDYKKQIAPYGYITKFATGGYTGEWSDNSNGRLAVLHQKELILNAKDTENMLSTVAAVRDIAGIGDSINSAIANTISKMVSNLVLNTDAAGKVSGVTEQDSRQNIFNINADFPNANSAAEIRDAIMSLPNLASQYLSQRNRK